MKKVLGEHYIIEFFGCEGELTERLKVEEILMEAVKQSGAKMIGSFFHQFKPYGVSGVIIIEESHLSIHTWPEYGYAAVDYFFCASYVDFDKALKVMTDHFKPSEVLVKKMERGVLDYIGVDYSN